MDVVNIASSGSLFGLVATKSHDCCTCWEVLVRTGFESSWGEFQWQCRWRIWPCLISDWLAGGLVNIHNLPLARHAAMHMSAIGWGNDCIQFKLSHKPRVADLNCGGYCQYKRNFTLQ